MIKITDKTQCTGCCACSNACQFNAIEMVSDEEGFLYPKITEACVGCSACESVCPISDISSVKDFDAKCYAAYTKDEEIRGKSSSGGIFSMLAETVLEKNGVVFGAGFEDDALTIIV